MPYAIYKPGGGVLYYKSAMISIALSRYDHNAKKRRLAALVCFKGRITIMAKSLTRKQFDILVVLAEAEKPLSQRQIEEKTEYSLGTVNRTMQELAELGFAAAGEITPSGVAALEPYRAKRAIFIAAGFGSRMVPITFNTPKPLVRVHGQRIIDGLIDACLEAGINEFYIVRGFLAEQCDQLLY